MKITPILAFRDNYIWCIQKASSSYVAVVDPGDAKPVLDWLEQHQANLATILITHRHQDHIGGVKELLKHYPQTTVIAPWGDSMVGNYQFVREQDTVEIPELGLKFQVLEMPAHTKGHIAYYGENCLFCGDVLFGCCCGKIFEGTPAQMFQTLNKLMALPKETLIYCAHEYTLENIEFAKWVEPQNNALLKREEQAKQQRLENLPTVPFSLEIELATDPFLRTSQLTVKQAVENFAQRSLQSAEQVFEQLYYWKQRDFN
ncbi:MAG: hypothetical protein RIT27_1863 [Pseudomonadota bacterium]|jgi:hydroxyacylglutathione hydrolase